MTGTTGDVLKNYGARLSVCAMLALGGLSTGSAIVNGIQTAESYGAEQAYRIDHNFAMATKQHGETETQLMQTVTSGIIALFGLGGGFGCRMLLQRQEERPSRAR